MEANSTAVTRTASAVFLGDVRLYDQYEGPLLDDAVQAYVDEHQIRCCNFEGAAYHAPAATRKKVGPAVLQGRNAAQRVLKSGFNLIPLANNHIMDYGDAGLQATIQAFSGVTTLGAAETEALADRPYILEINGLKLGFLSMCERQYGTLDGTRSSGTSWICGAQTMNHIRLLRSECSHVILLCHAGLEEVEQPIPQWREMYKRFIDAGATAVIASHPHVAQGWEQYRSGLIVYSLGNAAWEPEKEFEGQKSLLVSLRFSGGGAVTMEPRPVEYRSGRICFDDSEETRSRFARINAVLADEKAYAAEAWRICRRFYEQVAAPDFFTVTGCLPGDAWQQTKNAAKLLVRKHTPNEPLLLHMLSNETYRWATEVALSKPEERN